MRAGGLCEQAAAPRVASRGQRHRVRRCQLPLPALHNQALMLQRLRPESSLVAAHCARPSGGCAGTAASAEKPGLIDDSRRSGACGRRLWGGATRVRSAKPRVVAQWLGDDARSAQERQAVPHSALVGGRCCRFPSRRRRAVPRPSSSCACAPSANCWGCVSFGLPSCLVRFTCSLCSPGRAQLPRLWQCCRTGAGLGGRGFESESCRKKERNMLAKQGCVLESPVAFRPFVG